ncbi:hypothetical protein cypCar_00018824, partial [Cyprinus carpio]
KINRRRKEETSDEEDDETKAVVRSKVDEAKELQSFSKKAAWSKVGHMSNWNDFHFIRI